VLPAAFPVGAAPPLAAAHRPGSPPRTPAPAAPAAAVPTADLTIHDRPFLPVDRSEAGHWEGDLIIGDNHLSAIGTLVERQTRMVRLVHLPRSDGDSLHAALVARMRDLPPALMRSITWDQGTEMARHLATTDKLGAPVYFCDSRSPWQRGSNENTNGLLRDYFPKGVSLAKHPPQHLLAVEHELNRRPRMVLGDRCPADLFAALLALQNPSVLRR
jgi:transposase, IS30 family